MLEGSRLARRNDALPSGSAMDGPVGVLPVASRFSLRVKGVPVPPSLPSLPGRENVAGLPLALPINRCAVLGERTVVRPGPDEWLLIGPEADTDAMATEIERALGGRFHALVDVSHRHVAFDVSGRARRTSSTPAARSTCTPPASRPAPAPARSSARPRSC